MSSMNATWALLVLIGLTGSGVIGLQLGRLRGARRKLSDAEPGTAAAKEAKARVERAEDQATFGVLMVAGRVRNGRSGDLGNSLALQHSIVGEMDCRAETDF